MPELVSLQSLSESEKQTLASRVADLLREDALVLLPTETVYGVAASARHANALGRLAALTPGIKRTISAKAVGPTGFTWHAPGREEAMRALRPAWPAHKRFFEKLTPGPVRILFETDSQDPIADEIPGAFLTDGCLSVRVPDHDFTRAVLDAAKAPVVMDRAPSHIASTGRIIDSADIMQSLESVGIALAIDAGPTRYGKISTAVRLTSPGGYKVESPGALDSKAIDQALETRILFVCSGNTCRSPMAEAIAADLLSKAPPSPLKVRVSSAGTSAQDGDPATPQGLQALGALGIAPPRKPHRSRDLTEQMLREADAVFTMTRAHRDAVLALDPAAAPKVWLIDPSESDIPDPIGSGLDAYIRTAERLRAGILQRLNERHLLPEAREKKTRARVAGEKK
ncbi:MAG: Sua5/YciO/YrdC/YwlC family protein [Phycisphaerales bacterium]|nr:Sua5/YciO/YrdC/YwlC family protein [Planctomycetota bacterium]